MGLDGGGERLMLSLGVADAHVKTERAVEGTARCHRSRVGNPARRPAQRIPGHGASPAVPTKFRLAEGGAILRALQSPGAEARTRSRAETASQSSRPWASDEA